MTSCYVMAVKSIGLSKIGGRKPCTLENAAKHNKRESAPDLESRGRIDGDRVRLNYSIAGAVDANDVMAMASQLMADIGTSPDKLRRDYCQAVEIIFSLPTSTTIDAAQYFTDCVAWCRDRFGDCNILSADVHRDEAAPHCHALIAPIQWGRWVGGKLIDRANTQSMRESFGRQVAAVYGLRMADKLTGGRKADAVAMVLARIESHHGGVIGSDLWQPLRQAIERNPAPFIASMGLTLTNRPAAKRKTMAQIFTSTGKGPKREKMTLPKANPIGIAATAGQANPIGIDGKLTVAKPTHANPIGIQNRHGKHQSLSCVGFAFQKSRFATTLIAGPDTTKDDGRMVDREFDQTSTDTADVVIDDDGVIRERYHQTLPDHSDQLGDAW